MHRSSYCGVNCEKCNAYIATATSDRSLKLRVIDEWGGLYKREFTEDDINCKGCKSDTLFSLCALCDIRTCNGEHGVANCVDCGDYRCERIQQFFNFHKAYDTGNVFD